MREPEPAEEEKKFHLLRLLAWIGAILVVIAGVAAVIDIMVLG